jgi:hypothetical protein
MVDSDSSPESRIPGLGYSNCIPNRLCHSGLTIVGLYIGFNYMQDEEIASLKPRLIASDCHMHADALFKHN